MFPLTIPTLLWKPGAHVRTKASLVQITVNHVKIKQLKYFQTLSTWTFISMMRSIYAVFWAVTSSVLFLSVISSVCVVTSAALRVGLTSHRNSGSAVIHWPWHATWRFFIFTLISISPFSDVLTDLLTANCDYSLLSDATAADSELLWERIVIQEVPQLAVAQPWVLNSFGWRKLQGLKTAGTTEFILEQ